MLPHFSSFRTGAAHAAPVSFRFERGQHLLPPFLFVSNGAACAAPFLFISNGGSVCYPLFSSLTAEPTPHRRFGGRIPPAASTTTTGQRAIYTPPCSISFIPPVVGGISCGDDNDNEAVCNLHTALVFFLFPPGVDEDNGVA
jgi:hypothetical protein